MLIIGVDYHPSFQQIEEQRIVLAKLSCARGRRSCSLFWTVRPADTELCPQGKLEDQNKAMARAAFFDYLNHRDFKRFEEIHTKDFVKHHNNSPAENLSEEMRDAKGQFDSSSDLTFTENWMIAERNKVAVCFTAKGTHDGPFQGVPATGKRFELSSMIVWCFVNGKIAEEWVFFNDLDLYRQLGLFKEPGSTDH